MNDPLHILLAEDEDLVALALQTLLEGLGYRVTVTPNGRKALDAEAQDAADLLVTDMRMPVMTGGELVERIRRQRPALPIVVITGYSEGVPSPEPGRLAVLRKPFPLSALATVVQSLLPKAA